MLYDPKWKVEVPTEVPVIEPWQQILIEAAAVIKKFGWIRGDFQEEPEGAVCALGAIRVVQCGDGRKSRSLTPKYKAVDRQKAQRKLSSLILKEYPFANEVRHKQSAALRIINFNDSHCGSQKEIIHLFRKAAHAV